MSGAHILRVEDRSFQSKAVTLLKTESDDHRVQGCQRNFTFQIFYFSHDSS